MPGRQRGRSTSSMRTSQRAALGTGVQPTGQRGHQRAGVQRPGGRRRKTAAWGAHDRSWPAHGRQPAQQARLAVQQRVPRGGAFQLRSATTAAPCPGPGRCWWRCALRARRKTGVPACSPRSVSLRTRWPASRCGTRHRLGHITAAQAAQQRLQLHAHAAHGQHVLARQQVDGDRRQALRVSATATARWCTICSATQHPLPPPPAGGAAPRRR